MKTVSVVIPVYGVEKYLVRCVDSVLEQTYNALQIILVDDGSPDNCPAICDFYAQKDERVKVIHRQNGGVSSARNLGIDVAIGEYVCFFDSDDYIEADMIEKLVEGIEKSCDDVCVCGYYVDYHDEQENVISTQTISPDFSCIETKWPLQKYERVLGWCGYVWNKVYRRSFLKKHTLYFDENVSLFEDLSFNAKIFENMAKVRFISYVGYHYIQRQRESLGVKYYDNFFELMQNALNAKSSILNSWGLEKKYIDVLYHDNFIDIVWSALKNFSRASLSRKKKKEAWLKLWKEQVLNKKLRAIKPWNKRRKVKRIILLYFSRFYI